ncbi:hypothetical protein AB0I49_32430 [Streptomyces sp. NPDC050617]|uniref:hypothetical protein n=1 Tax=Streptomyces sp. NPDC050617 TaxID=3154628 RepID=UPI00343490F3
MNRAALRRAAHAEWGPLLGTVRGVLVRRKLRAVPMTVAAVLLTSVFQIIQNQPWGFEPIQRIGSVQAQLPWWLALLRTPLSLFVPALDLPMWGALAQLLIAFGIAEICLGRKRTLAIAYLATLAGTMYARLAVHIGPDSVFGLPPHAAKVIDTGPSAAVVGIAVYVTWRYRAWLTCAVVIAAMTTEALLKPNLAGKEHLAAITAMLVVCVLDELRRRRKPRDPYRARGPVARGGARGDGDGSGRSLERRTRPPEAPERPPTAYGQGPGERLPLPDACGQGSGAPATRS